MKSSKEWKDLGTRRKLLATAVRVTPRMIPRLDALVRASKEHRAD